MIRYIEIAGLLVLVTIWTFPIWVCYPIGRILDYLDSKGVI